MKKLKFLFAITIMFISNISCRAQSDISDRDAISMLKEFYTIYNKEWNTDSAYTLKRRLDSLQAKYCTVRLVNKIREPDLDHDVLTGDVPTDMEFLETLVITKDSTKKNCYIVSYIGHSVDRYSKKDYNEPVTLHVTLVKEKDVLKIDDVK